jgi:hypothetical protein
MDPYDSEIERERAMVEILQWAPRSAKIILLLNEELNGTKVVPTSKEWNDMIEGRRDLGPEVMNAPETFASCGKNLGKGMMDILKDKATRSSHDGFGSMVMVSDLTWLAKRSWAFDSFMGYETALNFTKLPLKATFLCQYDRRSFTEAEMKRACSAHERSLVDRRLVRSQWFIPNPNLNERMFV